MHQFAVRKIARQLGLAPLLRRLAPADLFLKTAKGVIHIGANSGQERQIYARYGLPVVWIEPLPSAFAELVANIAPYAHQRAYQRLIADRDGKTYTLHVANNGGQSSSILQLGAHREMWPQVSFTEAIDIDAITLPSFIEREHIDLDQFDTLVLDTQGSELLILGAAIRLLPSFRFIKCEVADFESYVGCCTLREMEALMDAQGFKAKRMRRFAAARVGNYYDVVYERVASTAGADPVLSKDTIEARQTKRPSYTRT